MPRESTTWDLEDDYGESHAYFCIQHGGGDAWKLQGTLLRVLGPVLRSAKAIDAAFGEAGGLSNAGVVQVMAPLLGEAVTVILETADLAFIKSLLKQTKRDGRDIGGTGNRAAFDSAYQGNVGELWEVLYKVLDHNFGPMLRRRLGNALSGPLEKLKTLQGKLELLASLDPQALNVGHSTS